MSERSELILCIEYQYTSKDIKKCIEFTAVDTYNLLLLVKISIVAKNNLIHKDINKILLCKPSEQLMYLC